MTSITRILHLAAGFPTVEALERAFDELGLKGRVNRAMHNHIWSRLEGWEYAVVNVVGNRVEVTKGANNTVADPQLAKSISMELNKQGFKTIA